jgi:putative transposase
MDVAVEQSLPDLHAVDDALWSRAVEREPVIRRLSQLSHISEHDIRRATAELGLSQSRIYTLVNRFRENPTTTSLIPERPGPAKGGSKLKFEVEEIIQRMIGTVYLSRQKPNIAALTRAIKHECATAGLPSPSRMTVSARLSLYKPQLKVRAREGGKAAVAFQPAVKQYGAQYALETVQIDHTLVDQIIVDVQTRQPIGRPWLTLAIDLASRMVTGFYLTLDHPSATSVAMTLRQSVLSKEAWLADRGIAASWPVVGIPDRLHMDNGKDFHSRALARGCQEYGIEQQFRPPATPHFGGHIERLIGTMMGEVHLLPGTTFSNVPARGDYDSVGHSAMTLAELEIWLTIQIVGIYHVRVHSGLGVPPNVAWQEALGRRPSKPRSPGSADKFLRDFLPFEHRMVRREGIHLFNIRYWDPVLSTWIGEHLRFPVKYDPRDLSRVFLQAPDGEHWVIPYANLGRPPITLWEHKRAMASLREQGRAAVDERLIFEAVEAQRAIVASAADKTLRARRAAIRSARALGAATMLHEPNAIEARSADPTEVATSGDRYLPYPLEDWS